MHTSGAAHHSTLADTELCVACGLCLPHCPTYTKTHNEAQSPRGRLALMRGLARGELPAQGRLEHHLAACLACRSCEAVCPSGVPYGRLLDNARALIEVQRRPSLRRRLGRALLRDTVGRPGTLARLALLLRGVQRSGLDRLLRRSGLLRALGLAGLEAQLPELERRRPIEYHYPAAGKTRDTVALFTGCIARFLDQPTLDATVQVLQRLGFAVVVPPAQTCCGALHRHDGALERAARFEAVNLRVFDESRFAHIIHCASGCGATLHDYADGAFVSRLVEASDFIERQWLPSLKLAPWPGSVAVHDPCTQRNVLRAGGRAAALLSRIPDIELAALNTPANCCGGGGAYALEHASMAAALRREYLESLEKLRPAFLATTNIGCALHLRAGLRQANMPIQVVHPVTLVARQLGP